MAERLFFELEKTSPLPGALSARLSISIEPEKTIESTQQIWYNVIKINSHRYRQRGDVPITSGITSPFVPPVRRLVIGAAFFVGYGTRPERDQEKCDVLAEKQISYTVFT
jgi:hypothetical protein